LLFNRALWVNRTAADGRLQDFALKCCGIQLGAVKHCVDLLDHGESRPTTYRLLKSAAAIELPDDLSEYVFRLDLERVLDGFLVRFAAERATRRRLTGGRNSREYRRRRR
jgi:hypothetical protein